jgi:GT2 family glycosyltransferase
MNNNNIKLSIVIVSWNVADDLQKCLASIYKYIYLDFEVIVVDNNSTDNTVEMLKKDYPDVRVILNKKNMGFAAANNDAINIAKGKYLLILNPDTYFIDEHSIPAALAYLQNHDKALLTGNVLNEDKTNQVAVRNFPTLYSQIITLLKLNNVFPILNRVYHLRNFDYNKTQTVDSIIGAFMLIKAKTMRQINCFDKDYFVWFEEVDLCYRMNQRNWPVVYFADAKIVHTGGQSFKQIIALRKQKIFNRSLLTYFKKHKPSWQAFVISCFIPINLSLTFIQQLLKIKKRGY